MKNDGISTIYDSDKILHKVGSRKGKTKRNIAKKEASMKDVPWSNKPGKSKKIRTNKKKHTTNPYENMGKCILKENTSKHKLAPDFRGEVNIDSEMLQRLINESNGGDIKITMSAWVQDSQFNDEQIVKCNFTTNELNE